MLAKHMEQYGDLFFHYGSIFALLVVTLILLKIFNKKISMPSRLFFQHMLLC